MLEDLLAEKTALFETGVHTELRAHENRGRGVALNQGNLVENNRIEVSGVCARAYKNGVYGLSASAEYSGDKIESVIRAATENALFMDKRINKGKGMIPVITPGYVKLNKDIIDTQQKRIIELCKETDNYIAKKYADISSRLVTYSEDSMEKILYTSDGYNGHTTLPRCYIFITMCAETKEGKPVEHFAAIGGYGSFDDNFSNYEHIYEKIDKLHKELMDKREGVYPEAGYKTVILGGMMSGMLSHEAVGHTVEADLVLGGSVAASALNERVASEKVSLVDFAHTAFGKPTPLPVYLDDEGVPAEDAVLIKDGILTGYMNNRESAMHFGMKPLGNARAYSFSSEPLVRMRNTSILPGTDKLEDMIASVDDGYYLLKSQNGQADLTGEFMFGVSMGYEIKKGKIGRALLDTTVTGVAFDMLKTVDMVSDKVIWSSSGYCGKKQPMPVGMGGPALRCKIMMGGR